MIKLFSLTAVLLQFAHAGVMSYGQITGPVGGDPNGYQAQALGYQHNSLNGLQYSQQGPAFSNYQQQPGQTFGTPGVYNGHYATPQSFPQPFNQIPQPQQQPIPYNNHLSIPQQQQQPYNNQLSIPQQQQPYNNQLSIPQQHQQQIASAFPSTQQESPALASARAAAALRSNAAPGKTPPPSQLGINFSSASDVSQLRFSGPGVNFSY